VTRQEVEADAAAMEQGEIDAVHIALRKLSAMCDGAYSVDGQGFNKFDSPIGKALAACAELTPRQAALGKRLVVKYRRQLS
jgi:hypothetical protein